MADTKVSALPAANSLTGAELLAVVQGGASKGAAAVLVLNVPGGANNPVTDRTAARPTGLTKVYWQTPNGPGGTDASPVPPANWAAGDEWIRTT